VRLVREQATAELIEQVRRLEEESANEERSAHRGETTYHLQEPVEPVPEVSEKVNGAEKRTAELVEAAQTGGAGNAPFPFLGGPTTDFSPSFGFEGGGQAITFALDNALEYIPFDHQDSIKELHRSLNMARAMFEGHPPQSCAAYLCVIMKDGLDLVYVAFFLAESNRVLVYTPDRQPETPEECRKIIQDGVNFIETVGFMMDRVELDKKEESVKMLAKIPVFHRVSD